MSGLVVDIGSEELRRDNENLVKDLKIAHKLLEAFRRCLLEYIQCCKCDANHQNKLRFEKLDQFFNIVDNRIGHKVKDATDDQHLDGQQQVITDTTDDRNFAFNDNLLSNSLLSFITYLNDFKLCFIL